MMPVPVETKLTTEREARHIELIRATAAFEHSTLRVPYLLNGGALVAALTFLGNIASKPEAKQPALGGIAVALLFWIIGLALAGVATHYGYLSQHNFLKAFRRESDWLDGGKLDSELKHRAKQHRDWAEDQRDYWKALVIFSVVAFALGSAAAILSLTLK